MEVRSTKLANFANFNFDSDILPFRDSDEKDVQDSKQGSADAYTEHFRNRQGLPTFLSAIVRRSIPNSRSSNSYPIHDLNQNEKQSSRNSAFCRSSRIFMRTSTASLSCRKMRKIICLRCSRRLTRMIAASLDRAKFGER